MEIPKVITLIELKRLHEILLSRETYDRLEKEVLNQINDFETFEEKSMPFIRVAIKIDWAIQLKNWNEHYIPIKSIFTTYLETYRFTRVEVELFENTFIQVLFDFYELRLLQGWW